MVKTSVCKQSSDELYLKCTKMAWRSVSAILYFWFQRNITFVYFSRIT